MKSTGICSSADQCPLRSDCDRSMHESDWTRSANRDQQGMQESHLAVVSLRVHSSRTIQPICVHWGDLRDDGFPVGSSRRNRSLPIGAYLHSHGSQVHWGSGSWGTVLLEYTVPSCSTTGEHAFRPGRIRTPRKSPILSAFLSPRNARAI